MNDTIPIDSIKDKMIPAINLVPVLNKIYVFGQIPDKLEDRKLFADVYKTLLAEVVGDIDSTGEVKGFTSAELTPMIERVQSDYEATWGKKEG